MKPGVRLRIRLLGLILALGLGASAFACTIPVFRFALDRWETDKFRLVMPTSWVTQPEMVRLLIPLRGNGQANIGILDSSDTSTTDAKLLFPHHDVPVWSGKLDKESLPMLLDSPARQELLKRVLAGDSAVWVVCTPEADKSEADRIEKRLRFLQQVAQLPVQDPNDPDSQLGPGPPLKLKFSVLHVSLDDPAEKLFAAMVAGPKQQHFIKDGTSFAGPVFAKGRVLGAWPLSELDDIAIEDASLFLIGRCSCRIKNENPGWDVVLKTDWERALVKVAEEGENAEAPATKLSGDDTNAAWPSAHNEGDKVPETYVANASDTVPTAFFATEVQVATVPWVTVTTIALAALAAAAGLMLWFKR